MIYDSIVIGLGPAGISSALYLKRFNKQVLLIGKKNSVLTTSKEPIENYYGLNGPIDGLELIENGINQAKHLEIPIKDALVLDILEKDYFEVITDEGVYQSLTVVLATGKERKHFNIPGYSQFIGKGISHCATCDGFLYRKKRIAIIGCCAYMEKELSHLKNFSEDLFVLTHDKTLQVEVDVPVYNQRIKSFKGNTRLNTVVFEDDSVLELDAVFIAYDAPGSLEFSKKLGLITNNGHVLVNDSYETNIPNLYAGGDIIGGILQIAKAAHDGMQIAHHIYRKLSKKNKS